MLLFHSISCFRVITFLAGGLFFHVPIHRPTICHTSIPFLCLSTQPPILLYCTSVNCSSFRNCEICISLLRKMFWCSAALVRFCAAGSCAACCSGERTDPSGAGRKAASCTVTLDLFYAFVKEHPRGELNGKSLLPSKTHRQGVGFFSPGLKPGTIPFCCDKVWPQDFHAWPGGWARIGLAAQSCAGRVLRSGARCGARGKDETCSAQRHDTKGCSTKKKIRRVRSSGS